MPTGVACRAARIVIADDAVPLRAALERVLREFAGALRRVASGGSAFDPCLLPGGDGG